MVHQSTNVLFDIWLTLLMKQFGPVLAQRIAVGLSCCCSSGHIHFHYSRQWKAALVSGALVGRPIIWPNFSLRFFNFYISLAFALLALASFWKRRPWGYASLHSCNNAFVEGSPLPVFWALVVAVYVYLARNRSSKGRIALFSSAALGVLLVGLYERSRFPNSVGSNQGLLRTLLGVTGMDQISPSAIAYRL